MTALQAISSALLSLHDDGDETPSDEFHFESEYVKSLLRQRTPSPVVQKGAVDKENAMERWRTPSTVGASAGRTVLGVRDMNSRADITPVVKPASYDPRLVCAVVPGGDVDCRQSTLASTLGHGTTARYPRRGRLTRLGPPKRTSRLSGDSLEDQPTEDTPPPSQDPALSQNPPSLSTIISNDAPEEELPLPQRRRPTSISIHGQYTPPASQSTPPARLDERQLSTPEYQEVSVRRVSGNSSVVSSSSTGSRSSASRSLGRSSLRNLIASTSQHSAQGDKGIDVALETVQKGIEALSASQSRVANGTPGIQSYLPKNLPHVSPQEEVIKSSQPNEGEIPTSYNPPAGTKINVLQPRKSQSPHHTSPPPVHVRAKSSDVALNPRRVASDLGRPRVASVDIPVSRPTASDVGHVRVPSSEPLPPPKMKGLSNPTSPSKSPSKKGKVVVMVNDRPYTRLSTIGRGGSSKVYKVISTTNNKIYALKKVSFDKADASAIAGYKNEIRLLNRMAEREGASGGESRCIRLFDWESCDEKGYLLMLMECGEIDFAHILAKHQGTPLSLNFVRVYWEQMLCAVQAIHEEKIVHSDLKPANFLMVQGQLKLIDFGIAKRMGDDTTNIHRDQQIGTVNYMSPEAILDTNQGYPNALGQRLMKLGKKSDVWSLGCILYQMLYGKTPFSDLTMYQKIQSIPDESYPIKFPPTGTGGVRVDRGAERCVRMCLVRDQRRRWGIEELLGDRFFNGEVEGVGEGGRTVGISVEEIGSLIEQTLGFGRMNGGKMLAKETIDMLAKDAFEKLRATRSMEG